MIMDSLQLTCLNAVEQFKGWITYSTQQTMSNSQQNQWVLLKTYVGEDWDMHSARSHNFSLGMFFYTSHTND